VLTPVPALPPLPLAGVRVLLVTGEPGSGQVMAAALARVGATVDVTEAGQAVAHAGSARPDVLVTGHLGLGDPTRGLLAQVRRVAGIGLRGVALVDPQRNADRTRARREGYDAELTHPVDSVDLVAVLLRVLGRQPR
jgi:CheY-like chemotaxis protein